jgi:hypothetical protein
MGLLPHTGPSAAHTLFFTPSTSIVTSSNPRPQAGFVSHAPPWHHLLPSGLQSVASAAPAHLHPATVSQLSTVQGLLSSQVMALPLQVPAAQVSLSVQALPSSQAAVLSEVVQPVLASQPSSVQALPSSQVLLLPATQPDPPHTPLAS